MPNRPNTGASRRCSLFLFATVLAGCSGGLGTPGLSQTARLENAMKMSDAVGRPPSNSHFNFSTSFAFNVLLDGGNVIHPYGGLYQDSKGSFYVALNGQEQVNFGAIVKLTPSGSTYVPTSLHTFTGGSTDGEHPKGALVDSKGTLYGTTARGGAGCETQNTGERGCGTVFSLTPAKHGGYNGYTYKVQCNFTGSSNGQPDQPHAGLVEYEGAFYGTSSNGGSASTDAGTVYSFSPSKGCAVLYSFQNGTSDGGAPNGELIVDKGLLYGTASTGGNPGCKGSGCGTVFSLPLSGGAPTILHAFTGTPDGGNPDGPLVVDSSGALYGTTSSGGAYGFGTVFKISAAGYADIWDFGGPPLDGSSPWSGLIVGKKGVLYGTTLQGGDGPCTAASSVVGCGTVYQLVPGSPQYTESVLYSFQGTANPPDGDVIYAGLLQGKHGVVYGAAYSGGSTDESLCPNGCGLIFEGVPAH